MTISYRVSANGLLLESFDPETGSVLCSRSPLGTEFVQILPLGSDVVVREDYYKFPEPRSNVYRLNPQLQIVWRAELPSAGDVYANPVIPRQDFLRCATWQGWTCDLDTTTGRLISKEFTK